MRQQQLPALLDRPAGENRRAEVLVIGRVDRARVVDVVEPERPGDPVHSGVVHLFQREDIRTAQAVAPQDLDGAVDPAGQLDVEGDDAQLGRSGRIGDGRGVVGREAREAGVEQVRGRCAARDEGGGQDPEYRAGRSHGWKSKWASMRDRLGAARSGGCSACIDRSGTIGVLPQSLTRAPGVSPPAEAVDPDPRRSRSSLPHMHTPAPHAVG